MRTQTAEYYLKNERNSNDTQKAQTESQVKKNKYFHFRVCGKFVQPHTHTHNSTEHPHFMCLCECLRHYFPLYRCVFLRKVEINMELNRNGRLQSDRALLVHIPQSDRQQEKGKKDEYHNIPKNLKRNSRKMLSRRFPP